MEYLTSSLSFLPPLLQLLPPEQVLLDAAADEKVSWGSYHAVTDMIPSLAIRYPYMCYGFLASLELQKVKDYSGLFVNIISLIHSLIQPFRFDD